MTTTGQQNLRIMALALGVTLVTAVIGTPSAQAQTYTVLNKFRGADGANPAAGLIADSAGNLYGTTTQGGASGYGVVFKLNKTFETVLCNFTGGADGGTPAAGLIRDAAGNLYGTAATGGASGHGVVFRLDTTGTETVLSSFTGGPYKGVSPYAGLIRDAAGDLYGTTYTGGGENRGLVFTVDTTGTETVLHRFKGPPTDGASPYAGLIGDSAGNLYGTTAVGGASNQGVVFKLDKTHMETLLYSFTGGADGAIPVGGLIRDAAGNLYGTTAADGASGYGVVFKLDTTGKETVVYSFTGGADGAYPDADLIQDSAGNLYSTTGGGVGIGYLGYGVVFKVDTTGTETVLYSFTGGADGAAAGVGDSFFSAGLIQDPAGNLLGTANGGGFFFRGGVELCEAGCGLVFMIKP